MRNRLRLAFPLLAFPALACRRRERAKEAAGRLVWRNQPMWSNPKPFYDFVDRFEAESGLEVRMENVPSESDVAHQFFLTALEGGDTSFDLLLVDVVWAPELAKGGWIADLSEWFPPERIRAEFLPGPAEAVVWEGRTYAVPWFADVGILYRRTDLVPEAPRTYDELRRSALAHPALAGYVWQGKQYEGLVCNAFEVIWGHGGRTMDESGRVLLDTPEAREALAWMRALIVDGISPRSVASSAEEESRRVFHSGRAVFHRNWPYAWSRANAPDSPIRGRAGHSPLPTVTGEPGWGCLGGWQLAVNANVPAARRAAAAKFIAHLTSDEGTFLLAEKFTQLPPRKAVYEDPRLAREAPFVASMKDAIERARPRPVTPYYNLIADSLQSELSAAITGIRTPAEALRRAQQQVDRIIGA